MELNREQIEKALDWLDSLVGNSNDSDIALFTYQLLGILYDTCEGLTEKNAIQVITAIELDKQIKRLTEENERLNKEVADLQDELKCEKETNAHLCSQYMLENHLRHQVEEMLANGMSVVKANTVRKMQERFNEKVAKLLISPSLQYQASFFIDQIAKEMVEGE